MSFARRPRGAGAGDVDHTPNLQYFNFSLYNAGNRPIIAKVLDTRSTAVLNNPSEFELSVVRFNVPTNSIPTSLVPFTNNPLIPTETILRVGLGYQGNIIYQNVLLTTTNRPDDYIFPSGAIFTYGQLLEYVNDAFATVYAQLVLLYPLLTHTAPPFYVFDPATLLCNLYIPAEYTAYTANPSPITIHLNEPLFEHYLCNVRARLTQPLGVIDWELIVNENTITTTAPAPRVGLPPSLSVFAPPLYILYQDAPSIQRWNCLKNIVLTSSLVPTVPEYVNTPGGIGASSPAQSGNTQSGSLPIITDFLALGALDPLRDRVAVEYVPTAEYRMVSMVGITPLFRLDLSVYWVDTYGGLHPLFITPLTGLDVKVMFRRRV